MNRLLMMSMLWGSLSAIGGNKVGNGDEGGDLEGAEEVTEGPLVQSRDLAVEKLRKLNIVGIPGLGKLLPEVERANLYLAQQDVVGDQSGPSSPEGLIYARTIPEEHSPTRFFPIALKLSRDQQSALHIHEGLHRSLPLLVRENERVVTQLTLVLTSPETSHDSVALLASDLIPLHADRLSEEEHIKQPSNVGYVFRQFLSGDATSTYPIDRMHVIHSDLYPFGGKDAPFGFGIEASMVSRPGVTETGPLGLSAKSRVWSARGFDVGIFGALSLNVLSAEELKNSPFGRDVFTLGISMKKNLNRFYVENLISYTFEGKSNRTLGKIDYQYSYGGVWNAKIRSGARLGRIDVGGFAELNLAEYFRVNGGAFSTDLGRYRILALGPEVAYSEEEFTVGLGGRFLIDSTRGANFDYLGDLMGPGVAQGGIQLSASYLF